MLELLNAGAEGVLQNPALEGELLQFLKTFGGGKRLVEVALEVFEVAHGGLEGLVVYVE